jgi:hypothetical protein
MVAKEMLEKYTVMKKQASNFSSEGTQKEFPSLLCFDLVKIGDNNANCS